MTLLLPFLFSGLLLSMPQDPNSQDPIPEVLVTATASERDSLNTPFAVSLIGREELGTQTRTFPEILFGDPTVMVQKTAYGQSSPFIRGFTAYRNLLLIDGIRLNHAAMRSGPNQYWSTVDPFLIQQLEIVRGPSSVLYGSDAIGGTVNAVLRKAPLGSEGQFGWGGALMGRYASAEDSYTGRAEFYVNDGGSVGIQGGLTLRDFNDLEGGRNVGRQVATAYEERNGDLRVDGVLDNGMTWTLAGQTARQIDVPRTHKTMQGLIWNGTATGSERKREQDQVRDLFYARTEWEDGGGLFDTGTLTFSYHRHAEERDRLRTGRRRDIQGFELHDFGVLARFTTMGAGKWSWGFEAHRETADSFRDNFTAGAFTGSNIQGSIGDDGSQTTLAAYVQNEQTWDGISLIPGIRFTRTSQTVDRVANPNATGPAVIQSDNDWNALVGSLRGVVQLSNGSPDVSNFYAGVSQGFRAPSISDTTSFDSTSVFERPSPNLEPEYFVQAEIGFKGRSSQFDWQVSAYRTWIRDLIIRSPTGSSIGGTPVVRKSNSGDGWIHGVEMDLTWFWDDEWSTGVAASWMDGEVDDLRLPAGRVVREPLSRLAPLQGVLTTRWEPVGSQHWIEAWALAADNQDELSLRDQTDTSRIPPGGTPGYTVLGITAGWEVSEDVLATLSVENITDQDYRVHGSGLNAPGRNVITTLEVRY